MLGEQEYFHGTPSSIDAVAYPWLANIGATPFEGITKRKLECHDNLLAFIARMLARCFPSDPVD